jgi:RHS repeat-associated protein
MEQQTSSRRKGAGELARQTLAPLCLPLALLGTGLCAAAAALALAPGALGHGSSRSAPARDASTRVAHYNHPPARRHRRVGGLSRPRRRTVHRAGDSLRARSISSQQLRHTAAASSTRAALPANHVVPAMPPASSAVNAQEGIAGDPLVVPAVQVLDLGQQALQAREAALANPLAVDAREESRTKYESLSGPSAVSLAESTFDVERPQWTPPEQAGDGHITDYINARSAQAQLPDGQHVLLASTVPFRSTLGSGKSEPVSLQLIEHAGAYAPANPIEPVSISKDLKEGISLPYGITVAPAEAGSTETQLVGNQLVFPSSASDTDFMAEPLPQGVELSWQLRSQASPSENALTFRLPAGVALQMSQVMPGAAEIVCEGKTLVAIPPSSARQADGAVLPVSYSVSGDTLVTQVNLSGAVDFPVLVDPVALGYYGEYNGAHVWPGWQVRTSGPNWGAPEYGELIQIGSNPGQPVSADGEWYVNAPGEASITRVDIQGLTHELEGQSAVYAGIREGNGEHPCFTFNGYAGCQGESFFSGSNYSKVPMAFCAQGSGASEPLCDSCKREVETEGHKVCVEAYGGREFNLGDEITAAPQSWYNYAEIRGAVVQYADTQPPEVEALGSIGAWTRTPGTLKLYAHDTGVGVQSVRIEVPPGHLGPEGKPYFAEEFCSAAPNGFDGCPLSVSSQEVRAQVPELETGVWEIGIQAFDAAGNEAEARLGPNGEWLKPGERVAGEHAPRLLVDRTPPVIALSGSLYGEAGKTVGEGDYTLNVAAEDGTVAAPQSGPQYERIYVDGRLAQELHTPCPAPGWQVPSAQCFDLNGSFTFYGHTYGAGEHTIKVVAVDYVGNESSREFSVTVNPGGAYVPLGPGQLNVKTGDYRISQTDVQVAGGAGAELSLTRSYDSREPSEGQGSALGAPWQLTLPDAGAGGVWQSLRQMPNGSVQATTVGGAKVSFAKSGEAFLSPASYQNETLSQPGSGEYRLSDAAGDVTIFTRASSAQEEAPLYLPTGVEVAQGAGGIDKTTYLFTQTSEGVVQPDEVIAPEPPGANCVSSLVKGCRALTFSYASETSAGEAPSQWGSYKGRLEGVTLHAFNPKPKEGEARMEAVEVAHYAYDSRGRLRAEWNPQISPSLKTTYGYDEQGHLTALSTPGQQPWLIHYGTSAGDTSEGRLLSVSRPPASTPLTSTAPPKASAPPTISAAAHAPTSTLSVISNGTWSNNPLAYSYQWQRCSAEGRECQPIAGAVNNIYRLGGEDIGHTLAVQVSATNAGGSASAQSAPSAPYSLGPVGSAGGQFGRQGGYPGEFQGPAGLAFDAQGNVWVADVGNARVQEFDEAGQYMGLIGREVGRVFPGPLLCTSLLCMPEGVAVDASGHLWVADTGHSRIEEFSEAGALIRQVGSFGSQAGQFESPDALAVDSAGDVWVADAGNGRVDELSGEGKFIKDFAAGTWPSGIAVDQHGNVFVSSWQASTLTKYSSEGAVEDAIGQPGSGAGQLSEPHGVAVDAHGHVFVADKGNHRVQEFSSETGAYLAQFPVNDAGGYPKEGPWGVAVGPPGESVWVSDTANEDVVVFPLESPAQAQPPKPTEGYTVHYEVPVQGEGAPHQLGQSQVAAWGQQAEETPFDATAIFPPDEPQSYPATDYRRATIYYMDSFGRTVDVAAPSGGIATSEYDPYDDVTRTLSADNRARALAAGSESQALSERLDTRSTYGEGGHELLSTLGPEQTVKLPGGEEVKARKQVHYSYDEGAPTEGGPYRLVTKTSEAAKLASGEEKDMKATQDSYSGQENLGWKLAQPTTVTGQGLTHETVYDPRTGVQTETKAPGGAGHAESSAHDSQTIYYSAGTEASIAACQNHPEWQSLPCEVRPAKQPGTSGLPELPTTTFTYNLYGEPTVTRTTSGSQERVETDSYDQAGRIVSKQTTSTAGKELPKVSYSYEENTGELAKASTGQGESEKAITSSYNALGELERYSDADSNTATYAYDVDGRMTSVTDAQGSQSFTYNEASGLLAGLTDSKAGTFTASYDPEGKLETETYPSGLAALHTYNVAGEPTAVEYKKTRNCSSNCTWYRNQVTPSIHGQWLSQESEWMGKPETLQADSYEYEGAGRLKQVKETLAGKCTTRLYEYDSEGNRLSLTTRPPSSEGKCQTEGGAVENHTYDEANRLIDGGTAYDPFGDITTLPAQDAGGEALASEYYADGQLQHQSQAGQMLSYSLDPARRPRETVATGKATRTTISHYDGPGSAPSWEAYPPSSEFTRDIDGVDGQLVARQYNTEEPVLQIANLHGDIVGTAAISETASAPLSMENMSEYGVPTTSKPAKYAWLGAGEFPTELPSGVIAMGVRSYVPEIGRFLQPDPKPGGSADAYAYTYGNPLNETDPSGQWSLDQTSGGLSAVGSGPGTMLAGGAGIAEGAIVPPPANKQVEEAFWADPPWDQVTAGAGEFSEFADEEGGEEEWGEEGGGSGEEEAAYHPGEGDQGSPLVEEGLFVQQRQSKESDPGDDGSAEPAISGAEHDLPLCGPHSTGPCVRYVCGFPLGCFKDAVNWVVHNAKKIVATVAAGAATAVIGGTTLLATLGCAGAEIGDPFGEFDCYKIAAFGGTLTATSAALTVDVWKYHWSRKR